MAVGLAPHLAAIIADSAQRRTNEPKAYCCDSSDIQGVSAVGGEGEKPSIAVP